MPLYRIPTLEMVSPTTLEQLELRERHDLQPMIRDNPNILGDDLLIISEEYSNWAESLRRVDLLAVDKDANIVVIELKRAKDVHMELQALRYAAMLAAIDFEAVVQAYTEFLQKHPPLDGQSDARARLLSFLDVSSTEDVSIGTSPRIILVSPEFSRELTTTVLWLNDYELDIRCVQVHPYQIGSDLFLNAEQIIPLPSAQDYVVAFGKKVRQAEQQKLRQRSKNAIPILLDVGILRDGMRLHLIKSPCPSIDIDALDDNAKIATFVDKNRVQWDYDGKFYSSLSQLVRAMSVTFGGRDGEFAGTEHWALEGHTISISEMAKKVQREQFPQRVD